MNFKYVPLFFLFSLLLTAMQPKELINSDPELAETIYFALLDSNIRQSPEQRQKHAKFISKLKKQNFSMLNESCITQLEKWEKEMNLARPGFLTILYNRK